MTRSVEYIDYPTNAEEFWLLCGYHSKALRLLTSQFHPSSKQYGKIKLPITAQCAEAACEDARKIIKGGIKQNPVDMFDVYLETKDIRMPTLLNEVWFGIPESMDAHSLLGFRVLCDLCSEGFDCLNQNVINDEFGKKGVE